MKKRLNKIAAFYLMLIGVIFSTPAISEEKYLPLFEGQINYVNPFLPLMPRKGDFASIKQYGYLRVLFDESKIDEFESNLLKEFADENELKLVYISVKKLSRGQRLLKAGMADVLLGNIDDESGVIKTLLVNIEEGKEPVSWTVRSKNTVLKDTLNHHLNRSLISQSLPDSKVRK